MPVLSHQSCAHVPAKLRGEACLEMPVCGGAGRRTHASADLDLERQQNTLVLLPEMIDGGEDRDDDR